MPPRQSRIKPHLYSRDLEYAIMRASQAAISAEKKALIWFFANCMDLGYTEAQITDAFAAFSSDPAKNTLGLRYFKAYLAKYVAGDTQSTTNYSEAW